MTQNLTVGVLIAGVLDYKRPIERPKSGDWLELIDKPTIPFRLSPFDEAALECGLKLRDANEQTQVRVVVTYGGRDLNLLRHIAAFKPDGLDVFHPSAVLCADLGQTARQLKRQLATTHPAVGLWILGREQGDFDDGTFVSYLAETMKTIQIENAIAVTQTAAGKLEIERVTSRGIERLISDDGLLMVCVTNDQRNRLRHPLMKNIAMAKQHQFEVQSLDSESSQPSSKVRVTQLSPAVARLKRDAPCQTFEGDEASQAKQFLDWLSEQTRVSKVT